MHASTWRRAPRSSWTASVDAIQEWHSSSVQPVLDRLRRLKRQLLRRRDLHRGAGRGVATFARRARLNLELAETRQVHLLAGNRGIGDRLEYTVDDRLRGGLRQAVVGSDLIDQVRCVHGCLHHRRGTMPQPEKPASIG